MAQRDRKLQGKWADAMTGARPARGRVRSTVIAAFLVVCCLAIGVSLFPEEGSVAWLLEAIPQDAMATDMQKEESWLKDYLRQLRPDPQSQRHYMLQYMQHQSHEAALVTGSNLLKELDRTISASEGEVRTEAVSRVIDVGALTGKAVEYLRQYDSAQDLADRLGRYVTVKWGPVPRLSLDAQMVPVRAALYEEDWKTAGERCREAAAGHEAWRGKDEVAHACRLAGLWMDAGDYFRLAGRPQEAIRAYEEAREIVAAHPDAGRKMHEAGRLPESLAESYEQIGSTRAPTCIADCRERIGHEDAAHVRLRRRVDDVVERSRLLLEAEHQIEAPAKALAELETAHEWLLTHEALLDQLPAEAREEYVRIRDQELPAAIFNARNELCAQVIGRLRIYEWTGAWTEAATAIEELERHTALLTEDHRATDDQRSSWEWNLYLDLPMRLARAYEALERPADATEALERAREYWRAHPDRMAQRDRKMQAALASLVREGTLPERYRNAP